MGWDGSGNVVRNNGTNTGQSTWQDDAAANAKIRSDRHDTHDQDIADAIENTVALDGQTTTTTDNDILRFDSGQLKFVGVSVGANSILARSGSTDLGATSLSEQQVIGREGGDIAAISIGALGKPSSLSILKGLTTSPFSDGDVVYLRGRTSVGDGGEGHFRWDSSNLSTEVGNDEVTAGEGDGGIYVAPDSDKTGASGAWVRLHNGEIFVEAYGAKGDWDWSAESGTDDSSAIQAALDASDVHRVRTRDYFDYYIGSTSLTCDSETAFLMGSHSILAYDGAGAALTLNGKSDTAKLTPAWNELEYAVFVVKTAIEWDTGADTTSEGVVIKNHSRSRIWVAVRNFNENLVLLGDGKGHTFNTITLGDIRNGKVNIVSKEINGGFVNQSTFIGGVLLHESGLSSYTGTNNLDFSSGANGHTFMGTDFGDANSVLTAKIAGSANTFVGCRWEDSGDDTVELTSASKRNMFLGGYDESASNSLVGIIKDDGQENVIFSGGGSVMKNAGSLTNAVLSLLGRGAQNVFEVGDDANKIVGVTFDRFGHIRLYDRDGESAASVPGVEIHGGDFGSRGQITMGHTGTGDTADLARVSTVNGRIEMNASAGYSFTNQARMPGGFGDDSTTDLSGVSGDFVGQIRMNDGTAGSTGPYWWDGTNWNKMDDWTSTITP